MVATVSVLLLLVVSAVTSHAPCGGGEWVEIQGGRTDDQGWWRAEDGDRFPPGCSWKTSGDVSRLGCKGRTKPCLWKCCSQGQVMDRVHCVESNHPLLETFHPRPHGLFDSSRFELVFPTPCKGQYFTVEARKDNFTLLGDGSLRVEVPDGGDVEEFPPGRFCQEVVADKVRYLACFDPEDVDQPLKKPGVKFLINATGMIISLPFLLATLLVYGTVPELRNLHGKCLMSHVASLAVGFTALVVIQLGQLPPRSLSRDACISSGYIAYFFLLASFFWLHTMCFDIWWTFSGFCNKIGPKNARDNRKFLFYSLYAWGAAVVLLCVCAAMQFSPGIPHNFPRPRFGELTCWFNDNKMAQWMYFNGPVGFLIACNIFFFVHTALSILKIKRQTAVLCQTTENQRSAQQEKNELRFKLYLKLFVVMGVSWSMEIISTAIGGPDAIWWVTDLANVLVGIPIFIIFVWKSKTRQLFMANINKKLISNKSAATSTYELAMK